MISRELGRKEEGGDKEKQDRLKGSKAEGEMMGEGSTQNQPKDKIQK